MALHATLINENTLEFLKQVNGGMKPTIEKETTVLIYGDNINDPENEIVTRAQLDEQYSWHVCEDNNCNIVVKK